MVKCWSDRHLIAVDQVHPPGFFFFFFSLPDRTCIILWRTPCSRSEMRIYNLPAFRARVAAVCLALCSVPAWLRVGLRCLPAGAATSVSAAQMGSSGMWLGSQGSPGPSVSCLSINVCMCSMFSDSTHIIWCIDGGSLDNNLRRSSALETCGLSQCSWFIAAEAGE